VTAPLGILSDRRMSRRGRIWLVVGIVVGAVLFTLAARRPPGGGEPLDPNGTGKLGAKGLVLLLSEGGADVRVSAQAPDRTRTTTVVLRDTFDDTRRDAIRSWVEAGGTLVVADPGSPLGLVQPFFSPITGASGAERVHNTCRDVAALAGIRTLDAGGALVYTKDGREPGATGCFATDDGDFLVVTPVGSGTVVALGGAGLWINDNLDHDDNAGLAVALLAPTPGAPVQVLSDLAPDAALVGADVPEETGAFAVLPRGAKVAALQLALAYLVAVLWRARRLGRPVREVQPVDLPGSELVVAVGHLHHKGGHRRRAAAVLAGRARRRVADRLGVPRTMPPADLANLASARTGIDPALALAGLAPSDPHDDAALVAFAGAADAVERSATSRPSTPGDPR
jgi:hypothetical protein